MSLIHIKARIECDRCGTRFDVDLDAAYTPPAGWSLWDCAENAVRGGVGGEDPLKGSSIEGGDMLCGECTAAGLT